MTRTTGSALPPERLPTRSSARVPRRSNVRRPPMPSSESPPNWLRSHRPRTVHNSPYHALSLVGGSAHPFAPQLHTVATADGVHGTVVLGPSFEGGPGLVHGGVLSLLFDHAMGQAIFHAGRAAMTVSLEITYRAPTPLLVPLAVDARVERTEGRKLFVSARVSHRGPGDGRGERRLRRPHRGQRRADLPG